MAQSVVVFESSHRRTHELAGYQTCLAYTAPIEPGPSLKALARIPLSYSACRWWLIPIVALHNIEEWLTLRHYGSIAPALQAHTDRLLVAPPFHVLEIGWIIVTVVPTMLVVGAATAGRSSLWDGLVCWVTASYLANAIVPHLLEFVMSRSYSPGIVTALVITVPFTLLLLARAVMERYLSYRQMVGVIVAAAVAQPVVLALVFAIATALAAA